MKQGKMQQFLTWKTMSVPENSVIAITMPEENVKYRLLAEKARNEIIEARPTTTVVIFAAGMDLSTIPEAVMESAGWMKKE